MKIIKTPMYKEHTTIPTIFHSKGSTWIMGIKRIPTEDVYNNKHWYVWFKLLTVPNNGIIRIGVQDG